MVLYIVSVTIDILYIAMVVNNGNNLYTNVVGYLVVIYKISMGVTHFLG